MSCTRFILFAASTALLLSWSLVVVAQETEPTERTIPEFYEGLRATGAGSSHVALATGTDAIYQNPAGVARAPMYVVDGAFSFTPQGAILSAGAADSKLNPQFAGAIAYNYFFGHSDHDNLSGHDVRGVLAIPVVPERVSIGVGVRYLRITDTDLPVVEDEDGNTSQILFSGFSVDAGIVIRAADILHLGLTAQNFPDRCSKNPRCQGATPTRISGGFGLGDETAFMASGEATLDLTSGDTPMVDFGVGAEYMIAGVIPIRAGFERRAFLDRNMLSVGAGWRSEQAGIDFSYRHDLQLPREFGYVAGGFSVYF